MSDALVELFDELRRTRPPMWDSDAFMLWRFAVAQTIAAFPSERRRLACIALIAADLDRDLGIPLELGFHWVRGLVEGEMVHDADRR